MVQSVKVINSTELSEHLAKKGYPFTPARLEDLAESRLIPFVLVDGEHLRFFQSETTTAIVERCTKHMEIAEQYHPVPVYLDRVETVGEHAVPRTLIGLLPNLRELAAHRLEGIYFLCYAHEVVYVGSSKNAYARVTQHLITKKWDRAFFLPIHRYLREVEAAFIALLDPVYNKNILPVVGMRNKNGKVLTIEVGGRGIEPGEFLKTAIGHNPFQVKEETDG